MKDDGMMTMVREQRDSFRNDCIDCAETFDAIIALCGCWLETNKYEAQKIAMIMALAETGKTAATASMEV